MLNEVKCHRDPATGMIHVRFWSEDGEEVSFWSSNADEAKARGRWIIKAWDAPFILSEDQE